MEEGNTSCISQTVMEIIWSYSLIWGIVAVVATVLYVRKNYQGGLMNIGKRENLLKLLSRGHMLGASSLARVKIFERPVSLIFKYNDIQKFNDRNFKRAKTSEYNLYSKCTGSRSTCEPVEKFKTMYKQLSEKYDYIKLISQENLVDYFLGTLQSFNNLVHVVCSSFAVRGTVDIQNQLDLMSVDVVMFRIIGPHVINSASFDKGQNHAIMFSSLAEVLDNDILNSGFKSLFNLSFLKVNEKCAIECWKNIFMKLVQVRRKKMQNHEDEEFPQGIRNCYLNAVLQYEKDSGIIFSDDEIVEDAMSMQLEQLHFVATSVKVFLFLVGKYPEIQAQLQDSIDKSYNRMVEVQYNLNKISVSELRSMMIVPEMDAVLYECLRYLPPRPFIGRQLEEDLVIGGQKIPAGSDVWLSTLWETRNPQVFTNPDVFNPKRFLNNKKASDKMIELLSSCCEPEVSAFTVSILNEVKLIVGSILRELSVTSLGRIEDLQLNPIRGVIFPKGLKIECRSRYPDF